MFVFRYSDRNLWILILLWSTEPFRRLHFLIIVIIGK
ncbi:unnamed protein product [Brassica oleracea]